MNALTQVPIGEVLHPAMERHARQVKHRQLVECDAQILAAVELPDVPRLLLLKRREVFLHPNDGSAVLNPVDLHGHLDLREVDVELQVVAGDRPFQPIRTNTVLDLQEWQIVFEELSSKIFRAG